MNKSKWREVKLSSVFIAVIVLGGAAVFTGSSASENKDIYTVSNEQ